MRQTKILLALSILSISILPLTIVSCGSLEITTFESEGFTISSEGKIICFVDNDTTLPGGKLINKENYKGVTIKRIGDKAFESNNLIKEVILPQTLISIGAYAFSGINSPIIIPEN